MKRLIDYTLQQWKHDSYRKPLLLRGARQVGKTHAARVLGATFTNFVEINFEQQKQARVFFQDDIDPQVIVRKLSFFADQEIIPGKTLLFFDEIQEEPRVLTALRYFYEIMPELHVIAAGSLIDFTIASIGIPVGRVESLYMYPMSFFEFLVGMGHRLIAQEILKHDVNEVLSEPIHTKILGILAEYLAIGGMPEGVARWKESRDPRSCFKVHNAIIDTYRQDFGKYAKKHEVKYVEAIFRHIPILMGTKFKFSSIEGEYRKRELAPGLDLLGTAGIVHKVMRTAGNGIPLGAQVDVDDFKVIFLDVVLAQTMLGGNGAAWLMQPFEEFVNKGSLIEAFVGQEFLAYAQQDRKADLFYWRRADKSASAEVDYLIQKNTAVIPVEIKSGAGTTLKSMQLFLDAHKQSPYGVRFSTQNYSLFQNIHSYPLYAIAHVVMHDDQREMFERLSE